MSRDNLTYSSRRPRPGVRKPVHGGGQLGVVAVVFGVDAADAELQRGSGGTARGRPGCGSGPSPGRRGSSARPPAPSCRAGGRAGPCRPAAACPSAPPADCSRTAASNDPLVAEDAAPLRLARAEEDRPLAGHLPAHLAARETAATAGPARCSSASSLCVPAGHLAPAATIRSAADTRRGAPADCRETGAACSRRTAPAASGRSPGPCGGSRSPGTARPARR